MAKTIVALFFQRLAGATRLMKLSRRLTVVCWAFMVIAIVLVAIPVSAHRPWSYNQSESAHVR